MKFSANGYYVERYNKCANCGMLVYGKGLQGERHGKPALFCSDWCIEWTARRDGVGGHIALPIPRTGGPERQASPDMVMMNILDSTMVSICREMGILLMKTSYSTIFNEGLDFTCALADAKGDMIACAEFCPTMIGGMPLLIKTCFQEIPHEDIEPGDVILHNDPYRGGLHCPEHTFFKPFFDGDELLGFAVCIGHVAEIGGMVPGAFCGEATEIFHEGMRVPPVKIKKAGRDVDEVWKLLLANTRTPRQNYGDLRAMIGSVDLGVTRIGQIVEKYGREVFKSTCEDLMDYAERRMRAELASFPDGKYSFEDVIENDGIEAKPYTVAIDLHINGDELVADYDRSSAAGAGADQRDAGRGHGRRLQRHAARDRPLDSQELRLLSADSRRRPARQGRQCRLSGTARRRQHRDPPEARQHHHRCHVPLRARAGDGVRELHRHQLRLRRRAPGLPRVLRLLRHHVRWLGRQAGPRRQ